MAKNKAKPKNNAKKPAKPAKKPEIKAKKPAPAPAKAAKPAPAKAGKTPPAPAKGKIAETKPQAAAKPASKGSILSLGAGSKPEWGVKRICPSCQARFYDMKKDPILCPKCGTTIDPEALTRSSKRGKNAAAAIEAEKERLKKAKKSVIATDDDEDIEIENLPEVEEETDGEEAGDEVIEDTSDLGDEAEALEEVLEEDN